MRYLQEHIFKDLEKKMVFLAGPRQCGLTYLAKSLLKDAGAGLYFNWDRDRDRKALLAEQWLSTDRYLIFDEIHKYPRWKNWIKGIYDTEKDQHRILITGSARLDVFRRGGDSLLGRYHHWRLHPFSLSELPPKMAFDEAWKRLLQVGGFPEPFLDGGELEARRWRLERFDRVIRDDLRDLEHILDVTTLSLLVDLLKTRVGGPIIMSNLAQDLQKSPITIKNWVQALDRMYLVFQVPPFSTNLARAAQKAPKVYFFDNADVDGDEGARFENLVATHLLKHTQFLQDRDGFRYELCHLRDKEKREVDFVILKDRKVHTLVECKWGDSNLSSSLEYYANKLKPKRAIQIVAKLARSFKKERLEILTPKDALTKMDALV